MNTTEMILELQNHPLGTRATHPEFGKVEFKNNIRVLFWVDFYDTQVAVTPSFIIAEGWEIELPPISQGSEVVVKGFVYQGPDYRNRYKVCNTDGMEFWAKRENIKLAEEIQ
jgi:hypothetical protein